LLNNTFRDPKRSVTADARILTSMHGQNGLTKAEGMSLTTEN
jgi:hypothetical protein